MKEAILKMAAQIKFVPHSLPYSTPTFYHPHLSGGSVVLTASTARRSRVIVRRTRYHRAPSLLSVSS